MRKKQLPLSTYLLAGFPLMYINSCEEQRVINEVQKAASEASNSASTNFQFSFLVWRCTTGFVRLSATGDDDSIGNTTALNTAIEHLMTIQQDQPTIAMIMNPRKFMDNHVVTQAIKDAASHLRLVGSHLILVGPEVTIPPELEHDITFIDFPLPDKERLQGLLQEIVKYNLKKPVQAKLIETAAEAALGMTEIEAENAAALSLTETGTLDIALLQSEKEQAIRKSEVLEFVHTDETIDDVGDFDLLRDWISRRRTAFDAKAKKYGLPVPKGILVAGIPGTGKSLLSKAAANFLGIPLIKFNVGSIFKKYVGDSEASVRSALALVETISPVVLWIDEMDKSFSGITGQSSDSGVTKRVFQTILTWMQETDCRAFRIATVNNMEHLPPELYRAGRFDALFASDLPEMDGRKEIYEIHIRKRNRDPKKYNITKIAAASIGFTGAEIEYSVCEAMFTAYADGGREFTTDDILRAIKEIIPQSVADKDKIDRIRKFCEQKARPVSSRTAINKTATPKLKRVARTKAKK